MTGFNMVIPGNTAEATISPMINSVVEKSLPNKKGDFFGQLKKVQEAQVNRLSFIGKYNGVSENSRIITSALGTETSNNVNESNKIHYQQLYQDNMPETAVSNISKGEQLAIGSLPEQCLNVSEVVFLQDEALVLTNLTQQTGEFVSSPNISRDESRQQPAGGEQSNYQKQVTPEGDLSQAVVTKKSNPVIDVIVLDRDSLQQVALSGNSIQLSEAELDPHPPVFKPVEPILGLQPELDILLKDAADHENQPEAQATGEPVPAQPEPTNNVHNQQDSKGFEAGQLKLNPSVTQVSSQNSLVSLEGNEELIHSQVPVEGSKEVAPIRTNSESTLEVLKPLETMLDIEQAKYLKDAVDHKNQPGAQATGKPVPAQPEPTNNVHNQQDSKGFEVGQLKLDPWVTQVSNQDSLASVEGSEEAVAKEANSIEVLKSLGPIPYMQSEPGRQLRVATGYENELATKTAEQKIDIQPSIETNNTNLSQQTTIASTIAESREIETGKGQTTTLVDKQVEVDVRAALDRPLVQATRVNRGSDTTQPGFEPTANDEAGEEADITRKESSSVDVRKLIEFESHRFRGTKLNTFEGRENLFKEGGDENRPNLNILNRTDLEWLRSGIRNPGMDTGGRFSTNTREIIDHIVKNAELLLRANVSELKIQLKPEFLGRLTIKVALEDGAVIARLITENHQVKHMLESNLNSLKQSLESQGIKVERAEVNVQLNNGGMFDGSEDSRQYLWQEHQHSQQQSYKYWGDGVYSNEALEILESEGVVESQDYGINENGNLNFLI